jgi:hypothetical protein
VPCSGGDILVRNYAQNGDRYCAEVGCSGGDILIGSGGDYCNRFICAANLYSVAIASTCKIKLSIFSVLGEMSHLR